MNHAVRLGPLIHDPMTTNPILFPIRSTRGARRSSGRAAAALAAGDRIHAADAPCPMRDDARPGHVGDPCCTLRLADVIAALHEFGAPQLAARLCRRATCKGAALLARRLRQLAERTEQHRREWPWRSVPVSEERPSPGIVVQRTRLVPHPPCDRELHAVRAAARWYEAVSARGFSVAVEE